MTEKQAKRQLEEMLQSYTAGSVLHLLGEIYRDAAQQARQDDDATAYQQAKSVEQTLFVLGLGVDAACPS